MLVLAFLALTALPAHATVMVEIPMEQLVADADVIVHATVLRTGTQLETYQGHLEPHTITELRVTDWLKGHGAERIAIDEIGGTSADGSGSWIEGTPRYREGEEVVVFLRRTPEGALRTLGMAQGRFEVTHVVDASGARSFVQRDTRTVAFASWVDGQMQVHDGGLGPRVDYESFVGFVASVLEQTVPSDPSSTGGGR